ncbi:kinase-like domain-containing protein, partial [Blastocladiella britannica]
MAVLGPAATATATAAVPVLPPTAPSSSSTATTRSTHKQQPAAAGASSSSKQQPTRAVAAASGAKPASTSNVSSHQQQQQQSCDDKDGHYVIVKGDIVVDQHLSTKYSVSKLLGQGTFGKVADCTDLRTNNRVAVKIVRAIQKYREAAAGEIAVLRTLRKHDPDNKHQCIQLLNDFDHRNHKCMVFPLHGPSLFDFLKENYFQPFTLAQVREFGLQILDSIAFLHRLRIVHTDLKPENILLLSADHTFTTPPLTTHVYISKRVPVKSYSTQRVLKSFFIKVIDFGSAAYDNGYKSAVVSTRHYRAPEIILELGWSFACDLWSVGCILVELLIGEAVFQTHENLEHLAMMEAILGMFPEDLVR